MGRTRVVLLAIVVALVCGLWSAAAARAQEPGTLENVLVFSKTAGFRHDSIPQGIAAIQQLGTANGFTVTATEDAAQFTDANLANFDVVVFLSTTGDVLDDAQQAAFERYIQAGGGFVGIHAASDTEYGGPGTASWSAATSATTRPERRPRRSTSRTPTSPPRTAFPPRWTRTDEWYNFQHPIDPGGQRQPDVADYSPRAEPVHVLATVDESTYGEDDGNTADDDHPIAWCSRLRRRPLLVHGAWATRRRRSPSPTSATTCSAACRPPRGVAGDCGEPRATAADRGRLREGHARRRHARPRWRSTIADGRARVLHRARHRSRRARHLGSAELTQSDRTRSRHRSPVATVAAPRERPARHPARARLRRDRPHLHVLLDSSPPSPSTAQGEPLSRFTIDADNQLDAGSEQADLHVAAPARRSAATPAARSTSGPTAASTSPRATTRTRSRTASTRPTSGPAAQIWDAQRTSANTNNPNGKILRIVPLRERRSARPASARPTRSRPGNLFAPGTAQDAARDLRDGLPQPVPDPRRPGDELGPDGRLRP